MKETAETEEFIIKPEKYLKLVTSIYFRRHRAAIILTLLIALLLSIYITDFIYAVVVLVFGAFPFVLFHAYFRYAGKYDNKYLFTPKKLSFNEHSLTIHPIEENPVEYGTSQIKYCGYAQKQHLVILENKYMLNIPCSSFSDYETYAQFENWLNTQILRQTLRK